MFLFGGGSRNQSEAQETPDASSASSPPPSSSGSASSRNSIPSSLPGLMEDVSQLSIKTQMLQIQSNKSLTPKEKAASMQQLMMRRWNESQGKLESPKPAMSEIERIRQNPTYHNEEQKILGCEHYQRGCKLKAKCCGKWYTCRFCHDEEEDHTFDRYGTEEISCMHCNTVQGLGTHCVNERCGVEFARYYCASCRFYDNDPEKDIYHCDKCNICRIGKGLGIDYFHCDKCNACMSVTLRDHKCVERSLESDCPICGDFMFTSTTPVMFLPCGHCMHVGCYEDYTLTNYVCPLCSKSLGDMKQYFARIDSLMETEAMPSEYANHRSNIYCSDCERKSIAKYHFVYHKCQFEDCGSYNTKVVGQFVATSAEAAIPRPDPSTPRAPALSQTVEFR